MSTNTVPTVSALRQPRAIVQVNGTTITGLKSLEIEDTNFHDPSTFRVEFAIGGLPASNNMAWWESYGSEIDAEIFIGFPSDPTNFSTSDLTSMFYGRVDQAEASWVRGVLTINGRDLSSKLADVKSAISYPQNTASQIVTQIAGMYGLTPVVTSTSTKVGKYYQIEHVDVHDERTQWDLLCWLAREEQFVVFVKGKELHFQPPPAAGQAAYLLQWSPPTPEQFATGNFCDIATTRELTIAKGIKVTVRTFHSKRKKTYVQTATAGGGKDAQEYSYTMAGLDPARAQARANQILAELSQHEMKLSFEGPADNSLAVTDVIQLAGTGTAADQVYFPKSLTRTFDVDEGYRWRGEANNLPAGLDAPP